MQSRGIIHFTENFGGGDGGGNSAEAHGVEQNEVHYVRPGSRGDRTGTFGTQRKRLIEAGPDFGKFQVGDEHEPTSGIVRGFESVEVSGDARGEKDAGIES